MRSCNSETVRNLAVLSLKQILGYSETTPINGAFIGQRGGTVDTVDSKSTVREDVRVQVSSLVIVCNSLLFRVG